MEKANAWEFSNLKDESDVNRVSSFCLILFNILMLEIIFAIFLRKT